jgi:hypothetical protein
MNISSSQLTQYIVDVVIIVIAGAGEYLHIVPNGTFASLLLIVIGHLFGALPTSITTNALNANTAATQENTAVVATTPTNIKPLDPIRG